MRSKKMGPSPKSPKARRVVLTTPQKYACRSGLRCDPCYRMFVRIQASWLDSRPAVHDLLHHHPLHQHLKHHHQRKGQQHAREPQEGAKAELGR